MLKNLVPSFTLDNLGIVLETKHEISVPPRFHETVSWCNTSDVVSEAKLWVLNALKALPLPDRSVAELLGVSVSYIHNIKRGHTGKSLNTIIPLILPLELLLGYTGIVHTKGLLELRGILTLDFIVELKSKFTEDILDTSSKLSIIRNVLMKARFCDVVALLGHDKPSDLILAMESYGSPEHNNLSIGIPESLSKCALWILIDLLRTSGIA